MVIRSIIIWLTILFVIALPALGQDILGDIQQDNIDKLDYQSPILEYVCAGVFLIATMAIGFKPCKRIQGK